MKFDAISVKEAITRIENNKIFLPPIQRNFVWGYDRIVNLFDSLYRNYPIGNCIFWELVPVTSKSYPLYKFIKEFSENKRNGIKNEIVPPNLLVDNVHAVVDGQQRLSSLFIGLAGIYKYKKRGKGLKDVDANFVAAKLYVNLFATDAKSGDENFFDFLNEENAQVINDKNLWIEVGTILKWKSISQSRKFMDTQVNAAVQKSKKKTVIAKFDSRYEKSVETLELLFRMLNDKRLYYFDIDNQNLDEVVEIFTRVNNGGMTLKHSDLLFSILVAGWNEGRDEIKNLVNSMRAEGIEISQDFIMRCCLVLSDLPVKYKLETFTAKNINKIKQNWNDIRDSLIELCELLPEIGYINHPNLSDNALIPIAYFIKNGGNLKTLKSKKSWQQYYVVAQVNGVFGGQSDQVLEKIRSEINQQLNLNKSFEYQYFSEIKLPGSKTFKLSLNELDELVATTKYGSPHAYFLLSLIYPTVDFKIKKYEVDHVHPRSKFNLTNLKNNGIVNDEKIAEWINEKRDLLPNLQLLGADDNSSKRAKTIVEYLKLKPTNERKLFMNENLLMSDQRLLELKNFDHFFEARKKLLVNKLKRHFGI